ncbi:MAG TPA: thiamine-phosphate kinase [Casimicrobiaceae bacterium]|nr:thiamine-phosphate kinase [Casimicrobiaceae bacterium]
MSVGEFDLIRRHFTRRSRDEAVVLGIGDDAAIVAVAPGLELVLAVDMMVEGRHFLPSADPVALGHKILAVNLSDIAAMGATPRWALLAGALPDADDAWLAAFSRGLFALADAHRVSLIGGDTTRGPRNLCLTIAGEVPSGCAIARHGATVGDDVWVSGSIGDAMLALAGLQQRLTLESRELQRLLQRLEFPTPRVALGSALRGVASAMIDVSDGLCGDLSHILEQSKVGASIEFDAIPRSPALDAVLRSDRREIAVACLLAGGDDYELCFTAPPTAREQIAQSARAVDVAVTRIGVINAANDLVVRDGDGRSLPIPPSFDHFA